MFCYILPCILEEIGGMAGQEIGETPIVTI